MFLHFERNSLGYTVLWTGLKKYSHILRNISKLKINCLDVRKNNLFVIDTSLVLKKKVISIIKKIFL